MSVLQFRKLLYSLGYQFLDTISTNVAYPANPGVSLNSTSLYFQKWYDIPYMSSDGSTNLSTITATVNGVTQEFYLWGQSADIYQYSAGYGSGSWKYRIYRIYLSKDQKTAYLRYVDTGYYSYARCFMLNAWRNSGYTLKFVNLIPPDTINGQSFTASKTWQSERVSLLKSRSYCT